MLHISPSAQVMAMQAKLPDAKAVGRAGEVFDVELANFVTKSVETPSGLPFGQPAARPADPAKDRCCRLMVPGARFLGLAALEDGGFARDPNNPNAFPQFIPAAIMTKGYMTVIAGGPVTAGQPVVWNVETGQYSSVQPDDDNLAIPGAVFESHASKGETVALSLGCRPQEVGA